MKCPFCSYESTHVIETRESAEETTRRRRECLKCKKRFTTYERVELNPLIIIKKNGVRESFDRQKLRYGLLKACEKRSVPLDVIDEIVDKIESVLRKQDTAEISSKKVGLMVMNKLKSFLRS